MESSTETVPILTESSDYFTWRNELKNALKGINALHVLRDDVPIKPVRPETVLESNGSKTSPSSAVLSIYLEEYKDWKDYIAKDAKAQSMIIRSVSSGLKLELSDLDSAREMWLALEALHELDSEDFRSDIERKLTTTQLAEGEDPTEFLEKFSMLLLEAKSAGLVLTEEKKCSYFLAALPGSYRSVKIEWRDCQRKVLLSSSAITAMNVKLGVTKKLAPVTNTFRDLRAIFHHHVMDLKREEDRGGQSYFTRKEPNKKGGNNKPKKTGSGAKGSICWNCGKSNHRSSDCNSPKIGDGYTHKPKGKKKDRGNDGPTTDDLQALLGQGDRVSATITDIKDIKVLEGIDAIHLHKGGSSRKIVFLLDLGATEHICKDKDAFALIKQLATPKSFATAAGSIVAKDAGVVKVLVNKAKKTHILFTDVHYLEGSPANLLSQGVLLAKGWKFNLTATGGSMTRDGLTIPLLPAGTAGRLRAVWLTLAEGTQSSATKAGALGGTLFATSQDLDSLEGWHRRLGHMGVTAIKELHSKQLIDIAEGTESFKGADCDVCARSKATRLTLGDTPAKATEPLQIIHSDIAGPLKPSLDGNIYYITFIDDFTSFVVAAAMKTKSAPEVLSVMRDTLKVLEKAFDKKAKVLQTDGGREYESVVSNWLKTEGIIHQVTTPYTPQLNGVAERWNRTLKEMVASMLMDSKMDMAYWDHALQYATSILNMSKTSNKMSLEQQVWVYKPMFQKVYAFGSPCWVRVPAEIRQKADLTTAKAQQGKVLGLNVNGSGWKVLLDGNDKQIVRSRDVVFRRSILESTAGSHAAPVATKTGQMTAVRGMTPLEEEEETPIILPEDEAAPAAPPARAPLIIVPDEQEAEGDEANEPTPPRRSPRIAETQLALLVEANMLEANLLLHVSSTDSDPDPQTYNQAMSSSNAKDWQEAIDKELSAVSSTGTWTEVIVPEGANIVGSRWVFKTKVNAQGEIVKYRSRIVAQGFTQVEGVDYDDTFSPVARLTSLRVLLTLVATEDLELHQMDADTAFLNATLKEMIYMKFPAGYKQQDRSATGLQLIRALYGLKQSPREWWYLLSEHLATLKFERLNTDWGLYFRKRDCVYLLLYVDDTLIA
jgi:hypothetical protein